MPFANIPQTKLPSSRVCLTLSVRLTRAWAVKCFGKKLKTNCKEYIRLLISRKLGHTGIPGL